MKPWIHWARSQDGFRIYCQVCNERALLQSPLELNQFAAIHEAHVSPAPGWMGAGDVIASGVETLRAAGIPVGSCTACEKRRRRLNKLIPKVHRVK